MCGIAGFFRPEGLEKDAESTLGSMLAAIAHRGPDDEGRWLDGSSGVALGHRRLSIIDLSPLGHQPMRSADGRFVLIFNGEIYNYRALREDLERAGHVFRGTSDTEVALELFRKLGVPRATKLLAGMFAFAVWDSAERSLWLGRDRMGEKPLYVTWLGDTFAFSSEIKGLRRHPGWQGRIDHSALALYLQYLYVPGPSSIYQGVRKIPPGTLLRIGADRTESTFEYWSLKDVITTGQLDPLVGDEEELTDYFERSLRTIVSEQMVSDVPLGAFLSGGIDSSLITAVMQSVSSRPVQTFTIGFSDDAFNEATYAKDVASYLGTDHTEHFVSAEEALSVIPRLPTMYDEPFADSSQIPTFLVSQIARRTVTVALSGDGGDELLCGYPRYDIGQRRWRSLSRLPRSSRVFAGAVLRSVEPRRWSQIARALEPILPAGLRDRRIGERIHTLAHLLSAKSPAEAYARALAPGFSTSPLLANSNPLGGQSPIPLLGNDVTNVDESQLYQYLDSRTYLPDDIFVKVDRAAMSVSLETRAPLVDHRIIELAWRLPQSLKLSGGQGKVVARKVLARHIPESLYERPKMGFSVPLSSWLRGPLREWASDLLQPARVAQEGYFSPRLVNGLWHEHLQGVDRASQLWPVLMFQAWLGSGT